MAAADKVLAVDLLDVVADLEGISGKRKVFVNSFCLGVKRKKIPAIDQRINLCSVSFGEHLCSSSSSSGGGGGGGGGGGSRNSSNNNNNNQN